MSTERFAGNGLQHKRVGAMTLIVSSFIIGPAVFAAHPPPLPTPCSNNTCAGQSFLQYGSVQVTAPSSTSLTIAQSTSKAVLNWADFNIASGYTVNFVQPSATSAVLNNIWSADPSVIAGRLTANGQVYLYNQNGIVFNKGAQVDVAGLTASTLRFAPVTGSSDPDALFENGILSGTKTGQQPTASFVAPAQGSAGAITVNPGATLTAADGGRIMLLGSAVTNNGAISTPDGQTILGAATNAVYLAASSNPSMRGLLIEVDGGGTTGTVTNAGQITAARGNITLAGLMVNQQGTLSATTSVSANGSIYLVAGDTSAGPGYYNANPTDPSGKQTAFGGLLPNDGGTLVLAPGSVTEVLPDSTDTATLTAAQRAGFAASQVNLAGRVIAAEGNAVVHAPGATTELLASANPFNPGNGGVGPAGDGSSIYLAPGSTIDVSGLQAVSVPVTQNILQVTLETNDLQNDPLQRNGFLHGTTVTVDVRNPPKLFDVTPYANNIGSRIDQVLTTAGTIDLISTGEVITRAGSTLNVSGGSVAYQGGYGPSTTNLVAANGQVFNISTAPNSIPYVGVANSYAFTDPTWGVTTSGAGKSYYAGYIQGAGAGTINVRSPQVYLRGSMQAATVDGPFQLTQATLARGGTFVLGCSGCSNALGVADYGVDGGILFTNGALPDNLSANVVVNGNPVGSVSLPAATTLSAATQLTQNGFNTIDVSSNGAVNLPAGVTVSLAPEGTFAARSTLAIDLSGRIEAPGGNVLLQTANTKDLLSHDINLGPGAVIEVGGNWINDSPTITSSPGTTPIVINGGTVNISAAGDVNVGANSLIDVSGGGWINQSGQLTAGSAGSISLSAVFSLDSRNSILNPFTGTLAFGPNVSLLGASLKSGEGGTISLLSGSVTVGGVPQKTPGELVLPTSFFTQGGFSQFNVTAENELVIGDPLDTGDNAPVQISPLEQTRVFTQNSLLMPTGSSLASFTKLVTLPAPLRSPASVSFAAVANDTSGSDVGDVTLARDASIVTDPQASVILAANGYDGNLRVFGSILAPAGDITLQLLSPQNSIQSGADTGFIPGQRIEIGPDAVLAAPAWARIDTLDPQGYREGSVLDGGTISLIANKGFVQTDPGSLINVGGTVGTLDLVGQHGVVATAVAGSAGTITIAAREGIVLQGDMLAPAATLNGAPVAGAAGGTLNIELGPKFNAAGPGGTAAVNQNGGAGYPVNARVLTVAGSTDSGAPAVPPSNQLLSGTAVIDVATIERGGFDQVSLTSADTVAFAGNVSLHANASLTLDAPLIEAGTGAQVRLSAPYVAIGNYLNNADYFNAQFPGANAAAVFNPTPGNATLAISAQLIDVRGISSWSGFSTENLLSSGDIRFVAGANPFNTIPGVNILNTGNPSFEGALETSASLNLQGLQLYPTTATGFAINDLPSSIALLSVPTTVTISSPASASAPPATPLSAGGSLSISANEIDQNGVLRAPAGQLALNGVSFVNAQGVTMPGTVNLSAGSLTSVSSDGLTIPYGSTQNGTQWTYSGSANFTQVVAQPPAKQVNLSGDQVNIHSGATLNLSGGGDLYAYEFVAGQGGSVDVLSPANLPAPNHPAGTTVYTYAILPTLGSTFAPFDPQYALGSPVSTGQTITLSSGIPGLAAGTYALLPARYALLPGAYAIQVVQTNSNILPGSVVAQANGTYETGARFGRAGTGDLSSLTSTVLVASDSTVRTQAQYTDSYANTFFTAAAKTGAVAPPRLPADAGQLVLSATSGLTLDGSIGFSAGSFVSGTTSDGKPIVQQGLGGDVAITAQNIVVVDSTAGSAAAGTLQIGVQQLDKLNAQTLILGAVETATAAGEQLSTGITQSVELKNTSALTAPEIILTAQNSVTVDSNAQISAQGGSASSNSVRQALLLPGGGALLRVSSGPGATLVVDPATVSATPTGVVSIGSGATVAASGSLLLYGTENTVLAQDALISAPAVALYSSVVSLGSAPAGTSGLILNPQLLGSLKGLTDLTIGSSSTINFYGGVQLGTAASATPHLQSITLDSGELGGYGAGDTLLQAGSIALINSGGATANFATAVNGTGMLSLTATGTSSGSSGITLGAGTKTVAGFTAINLSSASDIIGQGNGSLIVAASSAPVPVTLTAAQLIGSAGSNQTIATGGAVTINGAGSASSVQDAGLGSKLTIAASSIAQNGSINMPAGIISLSASGGDVTLGSGSLTSAAGTVQPFSTANAAAPGGQISLSAAGNVAINAGATVDVSGATGGTGAQAVKGDAGSLSVSASQGTFMFAGATINGGAPTGANAGSFTLDVGSGLGGDGLTALDAMLAQSGFGGAINLRTRNDAAVMISGRLQASSFELTADKGSIDVSATGVIDTSGSLALNGNGGPIDLWAGSGLTLEPGAQLLANAGAAGPVGANGSSLTSHGGDITLGTASGSIVIASTAQTPVTLSMQGGGGADTDGTLTLRAPRTADDTGVQLQVQNGASVNLMTRKPVIVEGYKVYSATDLGNSDAGCGTGGSCDIADFNGVLYSDAATFAANSAAIAAGVGFGNVEVRSGIEVVSAGDLTLDNTVSAWDLASWNAALGAPVNLTLRAAGNLIFNASLSDGFRNNGKAVNAWAFGEPGSARDSAAYRLTGGADLTSANPLAVIAQTAPATSLGAPPNSGNVILAPGTLIRTGTGSIDIAAGGDLLLSYRTGDASGNLYDNGTLQVTESDPLTSAIYTAGMPSLLTDAQAMLFTQSNLTPKLILAGDSVSYPTLGGNVRVSVADDIRSAPSAELITDWLWRRGSTLGTFSANQSTSWWISFNQFQQGIGVLGGGDLSLNAGRDIVNAGAVIPSTGRLLVAAGVAPAIGDLLLSGGGNLSVRAGGDILSGVFEDDWGNASIRAGGAVSSSADSTFGQAIAAINTASVATPLPASATQIYPILAVGDGVFDISARSGVELEGVTNSTTLPLTIANHGIVSAFAGDAAFFPYAPNNPSALNISTVSGDVVLNADALANVPLVALSTVKLVYGSAADAHTFLSTYPATLNVTALSGNIDLGDPKLSQATPNGVLITLFPAATGNLSLVAQGSINNNGSPFTILVSEADPAATPSVLSPQNVLGYTGVGGVPLPQQPLHQSDTQPIQLIANTGDLASGTLVFPKAATVIAGGDIADLNFTGKNLNPGDVTLIAAGGNITYSTPTQPITNAFLANSNGIVLAGPGYLEALAGGTIDLGDANGIVTSASLSDSRLPVAGATIIAGAGFGKNSDGTFRQPADQAFIDAYLAPVKGANSIYASTLVGYMQQIQPANTAPTYAAALAGFEALPSTQQLPLIAQVLSDELSATGLAHTQQGAGYDRGYTAINTLFPVTDSKGTSLAYSGNIDMAFSQLKTQQGGDIDLLVPGGSVNVGVANPPASLALVKQTSTATGLTIPADVDLGILVLGEGAVQGFADQNFSVNSSRILTLEGGNIILWASNGNIDAGKGAKSASGAPPPVIQTDSSGNLFVDPSNAVSGSGIGQLLTVPGIEPGLVNLIAPKGAVNAGDAGIRVAGNLNIAAVQVIGAGNITVAGTSSGVPTSEAGAFAGALSGANSLGDASKNAVDQLSQSIGSAQNYQQLTENLAPTFISVKMFCLGVQCETN